MLFSSKVDLDGETSVSRLLLGSGPGKENGGDSGRAKADLFAAKIIEETSSRNGGLNGRGRKRKTRIRIARGHLPETVVTVCGVRKNDL